LPAVSAQARERLLSLDVDLRLEAGERSVTGVDRSLNRKIVNVAFGVDSVGERQLLAYGWRCAVIGSYTVQIAKPHAVQTMSPPR